MVFSNIMCERCREPTTQITGDYPRRRCEDAVLSLHCFIKHQSGTAEASRCLEHSWLEVALEAFFEMTQTDVAQEVLNGSWPKGLAMKYQGKTKGMMRRPSSRPVAPDIQVHWVTHTPLTSMIRPMINDRLIFCDRLLQAVVISRGVLKVWISNASIDLFLYGLEPSHQGRILSTGGILFSRRKASPKALLSRYFTLLLLHFSKHWRNFHKVFPG